MGSLALFASSLPPAPSSPIHVKPLQVGDVVPKGVLVGMDGKKVNFLDLIHQKPTLIIFYRGFWCPFCNAHLGKLQTILPDLQKLGYQVIAISPDPPDGLKRMQDRTGLTYSLYSDTYMELTRRFGLAYYLDQGSSMPGARPVLLPVPAAYLVSVEGNILYRYYNPDYRIRIDTQKLLEEASQAAPPQD